MTMPLGPPVKFRSCTKEDRQACLDILIEQYA
jgi:hypothetical protein